MSPRPATAQVAGVALSNPDRVLDPAQGLTKRGLAEYYEAVAPLMLPEARNRPLSLVRCPSGARRTCFFQRHWAMPKAAGLATVQVLEREGDLEPYPVLRRAAGLVSLAQYGVLEIHAWGARADRLEAPDRVVFDLDPAPDVPWARVVAAARALRGRLSGHGLAAWVKTSGGKGLHVVVPIERRHEWAEVAAFAEGVARAMADEEPDAYLATASKAKRAGRIFLDWQRNTRGATSVAPWSTRAREGAPVSLPVSWVELDELRGADRMRVPDVLALVRGRFRDPWAEMAGARQRLPAPAATPPSSRRQGASAPRP